MLSAAILVGGRARRLNGIVKPLLTVGNESILARQIAVLRAVGIDDIVLVGSWRPEGLLPARTAADAVEAGALGALYTALLVATADCTIVVAGDMPFVGTALLSGLTAMPADCDAVVPRDENGWHPLCACYRRSIAVRLKARLDRGELSVRRALAELAVRELDATELARIDPDRMALMNINTPADYERANQVARARA